MAMAFPTRVLGARRAVAPIVLACDLTIHITNNYASHNKKDDIDDDILNIHDLM